MMNLHITSSVSAWDVSQHMADDAEFAAWVLTYIALHMRASDRVEMLQELAGHNDALLTVAFLRGVADALEAEL